MRTRRLRGTERDGAKTHAISRVQSDSVFKDRGEGFSRFGAAEPSPRCLCCQRLSRTFFRGLPGCSCEPPGRLGWCRRGGGYMDYPKAFGKIFLMCLSETGDFAGFLGRDRDAFLGRCLPGSAPAAACSAGPTPQVFSWRTQVFSHSPGLSTRSQQWRWRSRGPDFVLSTSESPGRAEAHAQMGSPENHLPSGSRISRPSAPDARRVR
jgi:hypothetical protein